MPNNISVDLGLPAIPEVKEQPLFDELQKVYNAINVLAQAVDDYTGQGNSGFELLISASRLTAQATTLLNTVARIEIANMSKALISLRQPDEIGTTTPNVGAFTQFGANGKDPSGAITLPTNANDLASAITLVNALKQLTITFGLGA